MGEAKQDEMKGNSAKLIKQGWIGNWGKIKAKVRIKKCGWRNQFRIAEIFKLQSFYTGIYICIIFFYYRFSSQITSIHLCVRTNRLRECLERFLQIFQYLIFVTSCRQTTANKRLFTEVISKASILDWLFFYYCFWKKIVLTTKIIFQVWFWLILLKYIG